MSVVVERWPAVAEGREELVVDERRDGVAWVWLNRPGQRNATTGPLVEALGEALRRTEGARAVVIGGVGRTFSAGRDLTEIDPDHDDAEGVLAGTYHPLFEQLRSLPAPTIAAIHGAALGTGLGIALACDLVVAARSCRLGSPFARLGAAPDSGAHEALWRVLGRWRAMWLIATGELLPADDPRVAPLVSLVADDETFERAVADLAARVGSGPTQALLASRAVFEELGGERRRRGLAAEAHLQGQLAGTDDFHEGMRAFQERRDPRFIGR